MMRLDAFKLRAHHLAGGLLVLVLIGLTLPWSVAAEDEAPPGLIATLEGHENFVYGVAFSPDGKYVVTGSFDRTLRVWEAATGKELKSFGGPNGHQQMILSVAVSPDGSLMASGGADRRLNIWDFPAGNSIQQYALEQPASAVAATPDGKRVAGGAQDGVIKIWDTTTNKLLFTLKGHEGPVTGLTFSNTGQLLASSGKDETVRLWNAANGQVLGVFGAHEGSAQSVLFSPANQNLLFSGGPSGHLKYWNFPAQKPRSIAQPHTAAVKALALSPNYQYIVSGGLEKIVRVVNYSNGQTYRTFEGIPASVRAVAMAPNNSMIAAGTDGPGGDQPLSGDGRLLLWQNNGQLLRQCIAHTGPVTGVHFHPSSNQVLTGGKDGVLKLWALPTQVDRSLTNPSPVLVAVPSADRNRIITGSQDKIVRFWNVRNLKAPERQFTGHTDAVHAVSLSSNNAVLASGGADRTIRFWNAGNGQTTATIGAHAGTVTSLAFHGNNQYLLSSSEDGTLKFWQVPPEDRPAIKHPGPITCAVVSSDGSRVLTGTSASPQARLWNVSNGQLLRAFPGTTQAITCVALTRNSAHVAVGSADRTVRVFNAGNGKEERKWDKLPATPSAVEFSPDGKTLALGLGNTITLFNLADGKELRSLKGHTGAISALHYIPSGAQLLSSSADKTVRVWNSADGKALRTLTHSAPITALALSTEGKKVAAGGADRNVKVWNLADGKELATVATDAAVQGLSFHPREDVLAVAHADNHVRLVGFDGKLRQYFAHTGPVTAVGYHPDGKQIISASADKTARVWTSTLLWQQQHAGPVRQALLSPNNALVVSCSDDKTVKVWNAGDGKLLHTLTGPAGPVTGVGISADNLKVAAISADKTLRVWALPSKAGMKPAEVSTTTLPVAATSLALRADGKMAAVGVPAKPKEVTVCVYDTTSGVELMIPAVHKGAVPSLAFLSDNRTLLSASADQTCVLADVNVLTAMQAHKGGITGVVFHNSGTRALTAGADNTAKFWDLQKGTVLRTFGPLKEPVEAVAFSPDYTQVATAAGKTVMVWDANTGKVLKTLTHPAAITSVDFSRDKSRMVTGATDHKTRVWDLNTSTVLQFFKAEAPVRGVAYSNNNQYVISASDDKSVTINSVHAVRSLPVPGCEKTGIPALAAMSNGSYVFVPTGDGKVRMYNAGNGNNDRTFEGGLKPTSAVAVARNNQFIASAGEDQVVRLFALNNGKLILSWKSPQPVRSLVFSPDNQVLAGTFVKEGMQTWNVDYNLGRPIPETLGQPLLNYKTKGPLTSVDFPITGLVFYSAGQDKMVRAWKIPQEKPIRTIGQPNMVDAVAFSPLIKDKDGSTSFKLAAAGHNGQIRIYDVSNGRTLRSISAHPKMGYIYNLVWTPDAKYILSASFDQSMKLWDVNTGKMVREFKAHNEKSFPKGHRDPIYSATFSPDGQLLISGSKKVIKVWNVSNGQVVREFTNPTLPAAGTAPAGKKEPPVAHPSWVYKLCCTPDGKYLVSVGGASRNHGYLAVWELNSGKLLSGRQLPLGSFYSVAVSPDGQRLALGTGGVDRSTGEATNTGYILQLPAVIK